MKVSMVDPSLFTGRYDDHLCAALARRGHDVRLLGRPLRSTDAIVPKGYVYVPRFFRVGEPLRALLGEGALGRAVKAADYALDTMAGPIGALSGDIVHAQWLPFASADARLLARLKGRAALVHTVHNARAYHGDAATQARGYSDLLTRFDALIVHGETTREALLAQGVDPAHIHVVPHPPMQLARAEAADLAAVPPPAVPRILFFGTIRPYKGLDLLIDAALSLWRAGLAFELAIAGKPFLDVESLLEPVRTAGFGNRLVLDLGFLTEGRLDAHLGCADIVAFPYRSIDSSGAFLTALGYGAAMVATSVGMFGALDDADVALVPAGNSSALADALRVLVTDADARRRLGGAARALHERIAGWDEAAALTEQAYLAAMGGTAQA